MKLGLYLSTASAADNQEMFEVKSELKTGGRYAVAMISVGVGAALAAIRFLAGCVQTTPADDELSSSVRGGLLNYRTGKFDDGTDPAGIYNPD